MANGSRKNKFAEVRAKYTMYSADLSEQNHSNSWTISKVL